MRIVFGYGENADAWLTTYDPDDGAAAPRVLRRRSAASARRTADRSAASSLAVAPRGPEKSPLDVVAEQWAARPRAGHPDQRARRQRPERPPARGRGPAATRRLLGDDTTYIHCNTLADDELRMIADSGGSASIAPAVEANMGHGPIALTRLLALGVRPGLSVDTCTNVAGDLFGPMRAAIALTRAHANAEALERGEWVDAEPLPVAQALELGTRAGALANGLPSDRRARRRAARGRRRARHRSPEPRAG